MTGLRSLVEPNDPGLTVSRQCELVGLARSTLYYAPRPVPAEDLELMRLLDEQYTRTPFYGVRRMTVWLQQRGYEVNVKRIRRLLREMGLEAVYPKPRLSQPGQGHTIYPYLLRGLAISRPCQVWASDITYIRLRHGFLYLVAILDWFSRYVVSWEVSNTLDAEFCISALERALKVATPEIFNTDQGAQFTCRDFTQKLLDSEVRISMDGVGRCIDNVIVERLWRSVKYEEVYLSDYDSGGMAVAGLRRYLNFYNIERPHQSLKYRTPLEVFCSGQTDIRPAVQNPLSNRNVTFARRPAHG